MLANIWNTVLFYPILNTMMVLYHFLGDNLGLAILAIAVITRLAMIPLVRRQTEMTRKMGSLKPELEKLNKQYANNKEKLSQEQMKLYKKVGYNPLGCIGTFVPQLIILSVLIGVIRAITSDNLTGLYPFVKDYIGYFDGYAVNHMFLIWDLTKSYQLGEIMEYLKTFPNIFKMDSPLPNIILAILVGITQYLTTIFTQKMQNPTPVAKKNKDEKPTTEELQAKMQNSMMMLFPVMTAFITLSTPAALGVYWVIQSLMLVVQYMLLDFDKTKKGVQNIWDIILKKK